MQFSKKKRGGGLDRSSTLREGGGVAGKERGESFQGEGGGGCTFTKYLNI